MTVQLRDYQIKAVNDVRASFAAGNRSVLLVSPVGSGKTTIFSYISAGIYRKNKRVWVLAHRRELLRQISETQAQFKVPHGILSGGYHGVPNAQVLVASVFTLVNRIKHMQPPHLIIGDEAHHFTLNSSWGKIVAAFPSAKVLGVTATPSRLDGKGLGDVFNDMVMGPSVAELTARGFLSPAIVYAPAKPDLSGLKRRAGDYVTGEIEDVMDKPKITGSAVKHYQRYADGKRAVAFCCSIAHAEHTAEQLRAAGYVAAHVDGKMDDRLRDQTIAAFKRGQINVLTSCDLINEGFDVPGIECAILLRPTQSLGLHIQQIGRSVRPSPETGKTHTIILDHAGNTAMHGLIDEVRDWSLDGSVHRASDGERAAAVRTCPQCFAMHRPAPACPRCSYVYPANGREVEHVDGDLELQGDGMDVPQAVDPERLEQKIEVLVALGKRRGMKKPREWAFHVLCGQLAAKRAQERDVPHQGLINGLTEAERNEIWAKVKEVAA